MRPMDVILTNAALLTGTDEAQTVRLEQSYKPGRGERFLCLYLGSVPYKMGGKLANLGEMAIARLEQNRWVWAEHALHDETWSTLGSTSQYAGLKADIAHVVQDVQGCIDEVQIRDLLNTLKAHGYVVVKEPGRVPVDNTISQIGRRS